MSVNNDDEKAIGWLGRQEILTGLIFTILVLVPLSAIATLVVVFTSPELIQNITVSGSVDVGKFVDKVVESYDAFLLLLGVGVGTGGTISAVKLGKALAKN